MLKSLLDCIFVSLKHGNIYIIACESRLIFAIDMLQTEIANRKQKRIFNLINKQAGKFKQQLKFGKLWSKEKIYLS